MILPVYNEVMTKLLQAKPLLMNLDELDELLADRKFLKEMLDNMGIKPSKEQAEALNHQRDEIQFTRQRLLTRNKKVSISVINISKNYETEIEIKKSKTKQYD